MSTRTGPGFVCIGAQKSGTTWLYENLRKHSEMWMPPVKEIHYFNRVCVNDQLLGNWTLPHPHGIKKYFDDIKSLSINNLKWLMKYYELSMTSNEYLGLFDAKYTGEKLSGDITPAYSTLEERGVKYASDILDKDIPVIFIIRNPVYRSWSVLKMLMRYQNRKVEDISTNEIINLLQQPNITLGSEYVKTIKLWRKFFNNYHVLSFDELCESPRLFLSKISQIIKVSDKWDENVIEKRVWADTKKISMRPAVLDALKKQYSEEINTLREIVDCDCVESWHEEIIKSHEDIL